MGLDTYKCAVYPKCSRMMGNATFIHNLIFHFLYTDGSMSWKFPEVLNV
jgi:hypothetical protein